MQRHPLEIPEILAHIGSFMPTWTDSYSQSFKPTTLCSCLRVSKLWYRTFLPIMWHSFKPTLLTEHIPDEAVRRHGHLVKILRMDRTRRRRDFSLLNCTNLHQLTAFDSEYIPDLQPFKSGVGAEGQDEKNDTAVPLSHGKQLLRSNPGLRVLHWESASGVMRPLDVEDFLGFVCLQSLSLNGWNCSGGKLGQVLRLLARTLKKLSVNWIDGMRPEELLKPSSGPSLQEIDTNGEEAGFRNSVDDELVLEHLQSIQLGRAPKPMDLYLSELVKHCPNLTTLELLLENNRLDATRLAHNLRIHSPNLSILILTTVLRTYQVETLLQHGSATGFRELEISVKDSSESLVSGILQHASTLERLQLSVDDGNMDKDGYLRLLVGCTKLTHFMLFRTPSFRADILEQLKQHAWGCHKSLQELSLRVEVFPSPRLRIQQEQEDQQQENISEAEKSVTEILAHMGWECVDPWDREQSNDRLRIDWTRIRLALELVQLQRLDNLRLLTLDYVDFRPSTTRSL
ncbi:hypothetical protein BG015_009559 [Linnemannia schmuckeri]|uniref:F-box domain-containing protein n=1 Tax=Linnemannia schmuckeri TaxID=64567 RepID=A0A9P5RY23_9FUNG|nr:hypothetical protein BG015_009559 [Linnemannia schmuckeri]